ncbi:hypothetical protein BCR43DRAFT_519514 [Syncephalastrum racemosum]|uniref:Uncharacterized protein n=1 Tax=Syncephalastrum racemosum TaxID=13706 RepID=A0A1X2GYX8_SYNRA|nr:hypothetical protein BCR43DRAFT_519514 [Syncephalastrum racemosum]
MQMRHKEVDIRFNDEPIAELASAKRRSQGSAFSFAPPAPDSPIFHPGSIPAGDIAFDGGRKSLAPKKDSQMKWKRNTVSFLSIVAFASIEEQQPLKFVVTRPLRNDALDRTHTLATAFDLAHK